MSNWLLLAPPTQPHPSWFSCDVWGLPGELRGLTNSEDRTSLLAGVAAACLQVSSDGWVWRSAGCSCEAAGTLGFRVIQESEPQTDSFSSCQIQDEIMVGYKVKIEPAWVNKAARQDSINFCSAGGTLGLKVALDFFFPRNTVRSDWIKAVWLKQTWAQRGVPSTTQTCCVLVSDYLIKHLEICTWNMRVWSFFRKSCNSPWEGY